MKTRLALIVLKVSKWILEKFGRGGSMPGTIAMKIDPQLLTKLVYPKHVVLVTGTNGKTTTTNQLYEVFKKNGNKVISNIKGDNLKDGIVTTIGANTSLSLVVKADAVVLECDELNVPRVINEMKTSAFIVNNLFRDQGDRLGSIEKLVKRMSQCLGEYEGDLFLNGNDANVASFALYAPKAKVQYFGVGENALSSIHSKEAKEGKFCPICNQPLNYKYYNYAHIGRFSCANDTFGHFDIHTEIESIDFESGMFTVAGVSYKSPQNALFAMYNCAAIIAYATSIGIEPSVIQDTLSTYVLKRGRGETISVHGKDVLLNLIKNPTGANETMKFVQQDQSDKDVLIIVNDFEGDGRDVSWYWDAEFERIMGNDVKHIICSGLRAYDMALRFKYSDIDCNIEIIENPKEALEQLCRYENKAIVLANYTALAPAKAAVERMASE